MVAAIDLEDKPFPEQQVNPVPEQPDLHSEGNARPAQSLTEVRLEARICQRRRISQHASCAGRQRQLIQRVKVGQLLVQRGVPDGDCLFVRHACGDQHEGVDERVLKAVGVAWLERPVAVDDNMMITNGWAVWQGSDVGPIIVEYPEPEPFRAGNAADCDVVSCGQKEEGISVG